MKGLLLKDCYTLFKQTKLFLCLMILFAVLPGSSLAVCAIMYASLLPTTAIAYDDHAKWPWLAAMMPYSNFSLVFSKYLLGNLAILGTTAAAVAAKLIFTMITQIAFPAVDLLSLLCVTCVASLLISINLPLLFRFGAEKGRLVLILLTVLIVCGSMSFQASVSGGELPDLSMSTILLCLIGAVIIGNIISVPVSTKLYRKKLV